MNEWVIESQSLRVLESEWARGLLPSACGQKPEASTQHWYTRLLRKDTQPMAPNSMPRGSPARKVQCCGVAFWQALSARDQN